MVSLKITNEDDNYSKEVELILKKPEGPSETIQHEQQASSLNSESQYEKALSLLGFGPFQWLLSFICLMANASDAIEILCISFVLPSAECDLNLTTNDKGYLSAVTFAGMMIGSYVWGSLADILGRKKILIQSLLFNGIFAVFCGLSRSLITLLLFRFLSGVGVGGSIPVVWSYFSEFIPKSIRGRMLCVLASGWLVGNLIVIFLAYMILNANIDIQLFSGFVVINNWRFFMITSAIPSIVTALILIFFPESPKFCLYNGQIDKAKAIFRSIYKLNHQKKDSDLTRVAFDHFESFTNAESISKNDEIDLINVETNLKTRSKFSIVSYTLKFVINGTFNIVNKTKFLFLRPYTFNTLILLYVMFALCFAYYGLWMWLPELYKRMNANGGSPCSATGYVNSTIITANRTCHINNSIYLSSFISSMSNLPGNLFTIFFIDKLGRNIITSLSLISSGLTVFGIPFITSEHEGIILTTIFGGINVITFNSFGCTSLELYPTKLRSTAMGVQLVAGRLGAIFGNLIFGLAVDVSCYIPLLAISCLLISSGILSFKLPESSKMDIN